MADVERMVVPPAAPVTSLTSPVFSSTIIVGAMEERGLLPGLAKLLGDGGRPKKLVILGNEKSSISLFRMTPV